MNNIIRKKFSEIYLHDPFLIHLKEIIQDLMIGLEEKKMSLHLRSMKMQT